MKFLTFEEQAPIIAPYHSFIGERVKLPEGGEGIIRAITARSAREVRLHVSFRGIIRGYPLKALFPTP